MTGVMGGRAHDAPVRLRAEVLGELRLRADHETVPLRGPQRRLLVALLLADAGRPVDVGRLGEALRRGARTEASDPANAVHAHVTRLRRLLEPYGDAASWLRSGPDGYSLHPDELDLREYDEHARRAEALAPTRPEEALAAAEQALAAWGRPWGALGTEPELVATVHRLEVRHRTLEERWAQLVVDLGLGAEHADRLVALARHEPTREHRWSLAMRALVQAGRQAHALQLYAEARRTLGEALGIEPGADLRATHAAVLRQDDALARRTAVTAAPVPHAGDAFVGRVEELGRLDDLLARARVVTVAGLGGLGKSRLVAQWLRSRGREHEAHWVDLRGVEPGGALTRLAGELSLVRSEDGDTHVLRVLQSALAARPVVLVLDNADAAGHEVAATVAVLRAELPQLTVLATSRQPLGLTEERTLWLAPLPLPAVGGELEGSAVELALDRLGPAAGEGRARAVATAAGGLPVAVEMLAARLRSDPSLPPDALAEGPVPDPVGRAVAEAMASLSAEARLLLGRAAHLPGGMSPELADAVVGADGGPAQPVARARALRELVAGSLLVTLQDRGGVRYRVLQPVVDVAVREDGGREVAMRALVSWVRSQVRPTWLVPPDPVALRRVVAEWINLEAVLGWLHRHDPAELLELVLALSDVWDVTGRGVEGHRWMRQALAVLPDLPPRDRARALVSFNIGRGLAHMASQGPTLEEARALLQEAGAQGSDTWGVVHAQLVVVHGWRGDFASVEDSVAEVRAVAKEHASPWFAALADQLDAMAWLTRGDAALGVPLALQAAGALEELGDIDGAAIATYFACVLGRFGHLPETTMDDLLRLATRRAAVTGMAKAQALVAGEVARFGIAQGRADESESLAAALGMTERAGNLHHAAVGRRDLGLLLLGQGRDEQARSYLLDATRALLGYDLGAAALAVGGLAALEAGPESAALRAAAWALACGEHGMPVGASERERLEELAGPPPEVDLPVAEAAALVRDTLGPSGTRPSAPRCPTGPRP